MRHTVHMYNTYGRKLFYSMVIVFVNVHRGLNDINAIM